VDRAGGEDGFVSGENMGGKVGAGGAFGQRNAAFDLFTIHGSVVPAVSTAGAIVAQDEILVFSKQEYSGKLRGKGVNAPGKIRFDQHLTVNKDVSMLDMDQFARKAYDAFNDGLFIFIAVINNDDVAAFQRG